jgi:YD repeat-containing protein
VDALENAILQEWGSFTDTWTYDAAGRLRAEELSGKPSKAFEYKEGRLVSMTYGRRRGDDEVRVLGERKLHTEVGPDGRERRLTWDARGLLAKECTIGRARRRRFIGTAPPGSEADRWRPASRAAGLTSPATVS